MRSHIEFTGLSSGKGQAFLSLMSGWVENVGSTDPLIEFEVHSLAHSRGLLRLGISPINPPGKRVESSHYENEERRSHCLQHLYPRI